MKTKTILFAAYTFISISGPWVSLAQDQVPNLEDPKVQAYRKRQDDLKPSDVLKFLKDGNQRFAIGRAIHGGYLKDARERIRVSAQGQRPIATVLSCIDSRTAPELIFDTSVGDLFTVRVGANVVNDDILGSLEIAAESGSKVIIVLGHTECGGVKGACSGLELGHMTQLLERVKPAIVRTHEHMDLDPVYSSMVGPREITNRKYIAEVSHENARLSLEHIFNQSPILKDMVDKKEIQILSAIYDVDTGKVHLDE